MQTLAVKHILEHDFKIYGRCVDLLHPDTPHVGKAPILFYRDMMPLSGNETVSLSVTYVEPIPFVVDTMEYHTKTGECFLTLDSDTYIVVAPATAEAVIEKGSLEAFFVPAGVAVYLHPGVWHYAPYPAEGKPIHSLVMLPERTYANDCIKVVLNQEEMAELDQEK